ncbi:MAG: hypothetical protein QXH55_00495 [Candidatus Korarchaeota archaeon]|nr:hypothetical protein [Thermoproteota archaeon]MCR8462623.1 hypothetical protein [Thermoproteota archaeon]MCR8470932.1 hypothetical protein [Thermoproteota archaeon]MCR8471768.1 hypothetical protein [Thermoproteota archaeon]MCR8472872.1 hypothetical protein [Thermoproteota archaeon]
MIRYQSLILKAAENPDNIIKELLDNLLKLPNALMSFIAGVILFMLYLLLFVGILVTIWGILEWLSGWNETSGKRNLIKGTLLILIAIILEIRL